MLSKSLARPFALVTLMLMPLAACAQRPVGVPASPPATASAPAAASTSATLDSLAGRWSYALDTPGGGSGGYYVFRVDGDTLRGEVRRELAGPGRPMESLRVDGATVTFEYASGGTYGRLAVALTRMGRAFTGTLVVGETSLPLTGARLDD